MNPDPLRDWAALCIRPTVSAFFPFWPHRRGAANGWDAPNSSLFPVTYTDCLCRTHPVGLLDTQDPSALEADLPSEFDLAFNHVKNERASPGLS